MIGIVDGDYHSDASLASMDASLKVLPVHEVESLLALPTVVRALADHLGGSFEEETYLDQLLASISADQKRSIVIERWKANVEARLSGVISNAKKRIADLDNAQDDIASMFTMENWSFKPHELLSDEEVRVSSALEGREIAAVMRTAPGKQFLLLAARAVGLTVDAYVGLIEKALAAGPSSDGLGALGAKLQGALAPALPSRSVPVAVAGPLL